MARMANAYAQTMKLAVIQMRHDVAQSVLAAVAAIELHAYGTGGQIQIIVRDQALLWLDLVVAQRRNDSDATFIHEGGRLEQPHLLTADPHPAGFAVQLAIETKAFTLPTGKGVHKPEPGVVPGSEIFGTGIAQPDNESQTSHALEQQ
jgi:hypothetical protein